MKIFRLPEPRAGVESGDAMRAKLERELEDSPGPPERVGSPKVPDHKLLQRIGLGAYGEVWLARNALGTLRAVKVVYRDRFEDERPYQREFHGILKYEPLSRSHEGLVAVLHVGRNDEAGYFYYVMELADNWIAEPAVSPTATPAGQNDAAPGRYQPRTLRADLAQGSRWRPTEAAQLAVRIAGALAHLHDHGLVHRDIKPSNIIFVGGQPKLADIGLVTGAGDSRSFVGTEGFIPPEGPGTPQADLYGLGKLLYELVTGQDRLDFPQLPPRLAQDPEAETLLDLNEVITRACAPHPRERYATATQFQADLNLFLSGRSLRQARKVERHLLWLKWVAAAACGGLLLGSLAVWVARNQERQAKEREKVARERASLEAGLRQRAEAAERDESRLRQEAQTARAHEAGLRRQAEAQELAARKKAYASDMNLLQQALADDDLGRAQELLNRQRPSPGKADLRGWEWRYFWQFCQSDAAFTLCQRTNSVISVSFSRDGTLVAVGTLADEVTVWDLASREMVFRKPTRFGAPGRLAFDPNSDLLAYYEGAADSQTVVLWDSRRRTEWRRLPLDDTVRDLAFTRDGRLITADLGATNNIVVWDVARAQPLARFTSRLPSYGMGTVFTATPDGDTFCAAQWEDSRTIRWFGPAGGASGTWRATEELTTALAFAPDGRTLATGGGYAEGAIKLWDLDSGRLLGALEGHRSWVSCLKILPDGQTLASSSADRTIRLWNLKTHQLIRTLRGHSGELWNIAAAPGGRWLASGCKDGSVIIWDLTSSTNRPPPYRTLPGEPVQWWAYSPDSRWCGLQRSSRFEFCDAETFQPAPLPELALSNAYRFSFTSDMRLLATIDTAGKVMVWDFPARTPVTNFTVLPSSPGGRSVLFLAGDKSLLTLGPELTAREWAVGSWQEVRHWDLPPDLVALAFSKPANLVAGASLVGAAELIPIQAPENRRPLQVQDRLSGLALSPDGEKLAVSSENGTVQVWNTRTLACERALHGALLGYHSVWISADGERLAAGSNGQEAVKLWDLNSLEEVATLPGPGSFFRQVHFSPDGNTISARNWNGTLCFWRAPSWEQIEAAERKPEVVVR